VVDYTPLSEEDILSGGASKKDAYAPLSEEDIARSANVQVPEKPLTPQQRVDQVGQNVLLGLGDIAGTVGSVGQLYDLGREKAFEYGLVKPAQYFNLLPKDQSSEEIMRQVKEPAKQFQSQAEREGRVNRVFGVPFPTGTGVESYLKEKVPGLAKEPETPEEEEFGKKIRFATGVAPGPGGVLATAGRFGAGYLGSTAGQEAEKLQERTHFLQPGSAAERFLEPSVSLLSTLGAQSLTNFAKNLALPSQPAREAFSAALNADIQSGAFNREAYEAAVKSGDPYRMIDFFNQDSNVRQVLSKEAGKAGSDGESLVKQFNDKVGNIPGSRVNLRLPDLQDKVLSFLESRTPGGSINAGEVLRVNKPKNDALRTQFYRDLHSLPESGSIPKGAFGQGVLENEFVQNSVNRIMNTDVPQAWGVVKPKYTPEVPSQLLEYDATGRPVMSVAQPARDLPGNLAFWDSVKKDLDLQIRKAEMAGTESYDTLRAESLKEARRNLVQNLDDAVKEYPRVRASTGELFGQDNAISSGIEFYKRMGSIDRAKAVQDLSQMSPQARELFRTGWMSELGTDIKSTSGLNSVSNKFVGDKNFQDTAKMALGRDYDLIRGRIMAANAQATSKAIEAVAPTGVLNKFGVKGAIAAGGVLPAAYETLMNALQTSMFAAPKDIAPILMGMGGGFVLKSTQELQSRRIADRAVKLMLSDKPADHVRLSRLMDADPTTAQAIFRLNTAAQTIRADQEKQSEEETSSNPPDQLPPLTIPGPGNRTGRATGGRIGSHDAAADRLVRMAEVAKKNIGKQTEAILNAPDEHVVKALAVANRNLEG
jgi:hypothetical protein